MSALNRDQAQILAGVFAEVCKTSTRAVSSSHISTALSAAIAVMSDRTVEQSHGSPSKTRVHAVIYLSLLAAPQS